MKTKWFYPHNSLKNFPYEAKVDNKISGWKSTGLKIINISGNTSHVLDNIGKESVLIPLHGSFDIKIIDSTEQHHLEGRGNVFYETSDVLYLGIDTKYGITGNGKLAIASAYATIKFPNKYIPKEEIPIELRGSGSCSREVRNFATPENLAAHKIIVCEVITPAGNISSYPPHKHDESINNKESQLEEIYYFEVAKENYNSSGNDSAVNNDSAFGMFASYSSQKDISINTLVKSGDIALVPHGYHGPAVALPGYNMYYLNIMAGDSENRQWLISDDPSHEWVRDTWKLQNIDERLPLSKAIKE